MERVRKDPEAVRRHRPAVLVLGLRLPAKDGLTVLCELRVAGLPTRVLVFSLAFDEEQVVEAIHLGAAVIETRSVARLLGRIRQREI